MRDPFIDDKRGKHKHLTHMLTFKDAKLGGFVADNDSAVTMMVLPWLSRILEEEEMRLGLQEEPPDPFVKPYYTQ
jgi:hypothetical protein